MARMPGSGSISRRRLSLPCWQSWPMFGWRRPLGTPLLLRPAIAFSRTEDWTFSAMPAIFNPETFTDLTADPPVRGFLHRPRKPSGDGFVLTHGAGSNCQSRLLTALSEVFANAGFTVLRCDLPYRQARSFGPPRPGDAKRDRAGLKNAM